MLVIISTGTGGSYNFRFMVVVNYRGSTGFGQDSIESLLNNVGDNDVKDVQVVSSASGKSSATLLQGSNVVWAVPLGCGSRWIPFYF